MKPKKRRKRYHPAPFVINSGFPTYLSHKLLVAIVRQNKYGRCKYSLAETLQLVWLPAGICDVLGSWDENGVPPGIISHSLLKTNDHQQPPWDIERRLSFMRDFLRLAWDIRLDSLKTEEEKKNDICFNIGSSHRMTNCIRQ